ncbi:hypothetical protein BJP62_03210 [Jeongeupia sp. USM3]|nr:hypothetical protein BJP62_03210 [Jeongeupia sp. USM3]
MQALKIVSLAVAFGCMASATAGAQGGVSHAQFMQNAMNRVDRMFDRLDQNRDGVLTELEREAARERLAGKGSDASVPPPMAGDVTKDGFVQFMTPRAERIFEHLDANKDGMLSMREMQTALAASGRNADR